MSSIGSAITKEEWAELRRQSCQSMPGWMGDIVGESPILECLPEVLLTYQQKLLQTTAANAVTVVEKSRRTGYTWAVAADAVLTSAAARSAGGMDTMYIGYNLDMTREFIDTCAMWAKAFMQAASEVEETIFQDVDDDGETRDIKAFRITFASGYEIMALCSRPRSLRGKQGYVIIDEAAFHDELAQLLKAAFAFLIWGGKVLVISTHDGDSNPFNQLVEDIKKGRKPYALITLDFAQALKDGLYQRICLVTGKEWSVEGEAQWRDEIIAIYGDGADEELFVIPSSGSGTFLPGTLIERQQKPDIPVIRWACGPDFIHVADHLREAEARDFCERELKPLLEMLDPNLRSFFGEDFAMSGDLTVIWPTQIRPNMVRRPRFVVELRNAPYAQQRQILWYILDRLPRFEAGAMDASGNGAPLAQETATRYGLERIAQVKINASWYRDVMTPFKGGFEDGLIELPRDEDTYNDHRAIKMVGGIPQIERKAESASKGKAAADGKKTPKRHGDSAIANLMAWVASRMEIREYDYTAATPRPAADSLRHNDDFDDSDGDWRGRRAHFDHGAY